MQINDKQICVIQKWAYALPSYVQDCANIEITLANS